MFFPKSSAVARQSLARLASKKCQQIRCLSGQLRENPGFEVRIHPVLLRDSCSCPLCVDPSTRQKTFSTTDIPLDIKYRQPRFVEDSSGECLEVTWVSDVPSFPNTRNPHVTRIHRSFLSIKEDTNGGRYVYAGSRLSMLPTALHERVPWDAQTMQKNMMFVDFTEYSQNDEVVLQLLKHLTAYGLVFVKNVPDDVQAVESVAGRIGNLYDSFYGRTWDVRSVPNAKNVAYTHQYLGLHMDLLYMLQPPYLQLLHCLRAESSGGESLFADAHYGAQETFQILDQKPEMVPLVDIPFHYHNDNQHYTCNHPLFQFSRKGNLRYVNWSPPFQAPFLGRAALPMEAYRTMRTFAKVVEAPENVLEYRLKPGECVIFNNRRILHARKAFDPTAGERWLKGAYIGEDVYRSRLRVLIERYGTTS